GCYRVLVQVVKHRRSAMAKGVDFDGDIPDSIVERRRQVSYGVLNLGFAIKGVVRMRRSPAELVNAGRDVAGGIVNSADVIAQRVLRLCSAIQEIVRVACAPPEL